MKCPTDGAELVMTERQGVEIDYCPTCRGVWLDRGELDKIIDRSARLSDPSAQGVGFGDLRPGDAARREPAREFREPPREYREPYREPYRESYEHGKDPRYHRKRKESWLGELFDF